MSNLIIEELREEYKGEPADFNDVLVKSLLEASYLQGMLEAEVNDKLLGYLGEFLKEDERWRKADKAAAFINELWRLWRDPAETPDGAETPPAMLPILQEMSRAEKANFLFDEYHRDHVVHTVYVYLLGLYFRAISPTIEDGFRNHGGLFFLPWAMIATRHDLGYPVEIFSRRLESNISEFDGVLSPFGIDFEVKSLRSLGETDKGLWDEYDSYFRDTIAYKGEHLYEVLRKSFYENGFVDHAITSGFFLLKRFAPSGRADRLILEMAAAIAFHSKIDLGINIDLNSEYYAYLLTLADELQCWDRYSPARDMHSAKSLKVYYDEDEHLILARLPMNGEEINSLRDKLTLRLNGVGNIIKIAPVTGGF